MDQPIGAYPPLVVRFHPDAIFLPNSLHVHVGEFNFKRCCLSFKGFLVSQDFTDADFTGWNGGDLKEKNILNKMLLCCELQEIQGQQKGIQRWSPATLQKHLQEPHVSMRVRILWYQQHGSVSDIQV